MKEEWGGRNINDLTTTYTWSVDVLYFQPCSLSIVRIYLYCLESVIVVSYCRSSYQMAPVAVCWLSYQIFHHHDCVLLRTIDTSIPDRISYCGHDSSPSVETMFFNTTNVDRMFDIWWVRQGHLPTLYRILVQDQSDDTCVAPTSRRSASGEMSWIKL